MSETEARIMVKDWHSKRNTNVSLDTLQERVFEKSGIFSIDKDSGTLAFSHRSFGEYLFAQKCVRSHNLVKGIESFDPYWVYIQFFQTGLLGDCEAHLRELLSLKPTDEYLAWRKIMFMPDYFLAG